jgi:hypothetical protein
MVHPIGFNEDKRRRRYGAPPSNLDFVVTNQDKSALFIFLVHLRHNTIVTHDNSDSD